MQNVSSPTNPLDHKFDPTGKSGQRPQPGDRIVVKVKVADDVSPGVVVQGHFIRKGGEVHIAMHKDQLPSVMERVRTKAHEEAYERAQRAAQKRLDKWMEEALGDLTGVEREVEKSKLMRKVAIHPAMEEFFVVAADGMAEDIDVRGGLPPLASAEVVSDWDPEPSPEHAQSQANDKLANAIREALREGRSSGNTKGK